MKNTVLFSFLLTLLFSCTGVFAQQQPVEVADKIIAVVGRNRIILRSELENQAISAKLQSPEEYNDTMKCTMLQQMILSKIMLEQADRDSIVVGEEEVEGDLDNRVRYFISRVYGSQEKMEEVTGKTIYQIKEENREIVKEGLLTQRVQQQILQGVTITPTEVKEFFNSIPTDSLPFYPAGVEVGQIVIDPPVSTEMDKYAKQKLEDVKKEIQEGKMDFETAASFYSQDPGSRDNGGRYDNVSRTDGNWAQEFVVAAFKLQKGEISPVIKTKFGYHIIQMIERKGDQANLRHILIIPQKTSADFKVAMERLDSVRAQLITGKIDFSQAVGKYSTDDNSKLTGGVIVDQRTGSSILQVDQLDPELALMVDSLKPGSFSHPTIFTNPQTGEKSCRIVYLKNRTQPHKANLNDDYSKIQQVALSNKQNQKLESWIKDKLPTYYIKLDPEYQSCSVFSEWMPYFSKK